MPYFQLLILVSTFHSFGIAPIAPLSLLLRSPDSSISTTASLARNIAVFGVVSSRLASSRRSAALPLLAWLSRSLAWLASLACSQAPEIYHDLPADFPKPLNMDPATLDPFHKMVARFEYARMGSSGVNSGLFSGINIALPPIMFFGSPKMKKRVIPDVVGGNNWICLAITEPTGGSDTANITTSAVLSDDGKHYIVNGTKKWITNVSSKRKKWDWWKSWH